MPPYRRRAYPVGRGRARRKVTWATAQVGATTVAAGAKLPFVDLLAGLKTAGSSVLGATVMRTHIEMNVTFLDTDTTPGVFFGTIVRDQQGFSSVDASSNFYDDWLMVDQLVLGTAISAVPFPINAPTESVCGYRFDVKSRRRLHNMNDTYGLCATNVGSANVFIGAFVRTLIALP